MKKTHGQTKPHSSRSVSLTFGFKGPYSLLYEYLPGFDGLRAMLRIHVLSMLSLAVLAGFGLQHLLASIRRQRVKNVLVLVFPALVVLEYLSCPASVAKDIALDRPAAVYHWLQEQPGNDPVVELPYWIQQQYDQYRRSKEMLYSTVHWKPLVQGFSGLVPRSQLVLNNRWRYGAHDCFIRDMRSIGVRYVVIDRSLLNGKKLQTLVGMLRRWTEAEAAAYSDEQHEVWELPGPWRQVRLPQCQCTSPVPQPSLMVNAGSAPNRTEDRGSWSIEHTGRKTEITVRLPDTEEVCGLCLIATEYRRSYPEQFRMTLKLSPDGRIWSTEEFERRLFRPLLGLYLANVEAGLELSFAAVRMRAAQITFKHTHSPKEPWQFREVRFRRCPPTGQDQQTSGPAKLVVCQVNGGDQ